MDKFKGCMQNEEHRGKIEDHHNDRGKVRNTSVEREGVVK